MKSTTAVVTRRQAWLLLAWLAWLGACSEPELQVSIPITASWNKHPISCGDDSGPVRLTDLRFYVQDVHLLDAKGSAAALRLHPDGQWQQDGVALLDLEDASGDCQNGTKVMRTQLQGTVNAGRYRGLAFTIGVPFDSNHADPLQAAPPLGDSAMHWSWRGGYKFLRAGIRNDSDGFWIHLGSAGCKGTINNISNCEYPNRVRVELPEFRIGQDGVNIDLAELLRDVDLEDGQPSDCSSGPAESHCDTAFRALGIDFATGDIIGDQRVFTRWTHH